MEKEMTVTKRGVFATIGAAGAAAVATMLYRRRPDADNSGSDNADHGETEGRPKATDAPTTPRTTSSVDTDRSGDAR
ncbi:MAG TPA: hypothetical protein VLG92_05525 [Candidatus Saccharimonadia bacterium]|nr:hypothetical protein [Candidatus Saccharimonadia bacterium]